MSGSSTLCSARAPDVRRRALRLRPSGRIRTTNDVFIKTNEVLDLTSFSKRAKPARFSVQGINRSSGLARSCALPTWWLWRGGRTRSLSEHGRETPLRPWYFVLRRGRVGRCQVCQTQLQAKLLKQFMPRFMKMKQSQSSHHTSGSGRVTIGRSQAAFVASGNKLIPFPRNMGAREHAINPSGLRWIETINPKGLRPWRGVEQPGSSSGS